MTAVRSPGEALMRSARFAMFKPIIMRPEVDRPHEGRCAEKLLAEQIPHLSHDQDHGRAERHQYNRRKDQKEHREHQLDAHLAPAFLRDLAEADADRKSTR